MSKISVDTARLPLLLHELRLPAINGSGAICRPLYHTVLR
jgi:hypothetical protein